MLATRIKQIAKEKGMKISDIAAQMHINPVNLSACINKNPTIGTLQKIADTLKVEVYELLQFQKSTKEVTGYIEVQGEIIKINTKHDILRVLDMLGD